jgi:hypothetical protein
MISDRRGHGSSVQKTNASPDSTTGQKNDFTMRSTRSCIACHGASSSSVLEKLPSIATTTPATHSEGASLGLHRSRVEFRTTTKVVTATATPTAAPAKKPVAIAVPPIEMTPPDTEIAPRAFSTPRIAPMPPQMMTIHLTTSFRASGTTPASAVPQLGRSFTHAMPRYSRTTRL